MSVLPALPRVHDVGGGGKPDGETRRRGALRMRFSTQAAELWKTFVLTPLRFGEKHAPGSGPVAADGG
jgi:hypothetical protein